MMLTEMAALGFGHVELSHGIRITLVPGILKAVEEGVIKVASVHNFCPLPTGVMSAAPNLFEPSAGDPREHDQWLRHTKRTIDFAHQVKAKVVVCHLGSVRFFWFNPTRPLEKYAEAHPGKVLTEDPAYRALLEKSLVKIRQRMGPYWERTKASINEVLVYAAEKGVKLGLENREAFDELPLDADYPACRRPPRRVTGTTPAMPTSRSRWARWSTATTCRRWPPARSASTCTMWTPRAATTSRSVRARSTSRW